jgi:SAM-dependent methyltransferase
LKSNVIKYSKSSKFYFETKEKFFLENSKHLKNALILNKLYSEQPLRKSCKVCGAHLPTKVDFNSHGIGYVFCEECNHLNGRFDDTEKFTSGMYISEGGAKYAVNYVDENYKKRTSDIYTPKIDFFLKALSSNVSSLLDVGCGGGYLVNAALQRGVHAVGIDVSRHTVEYGNENITKIHGKKPLTLVDEVEFYEKIIAFKGDAISAIGVIEHLRDPQKFFDAFKLSEATYLFYSVPMFSLSAIVENIFKDIFPRQLSGGHTHLFTNASIEKMNLLCGAKVISEWRFGTDILDIYRSFAVSLKANKVSDVLMQEFENGFIGSIDKLQSTLDNTHFCSEIHSVIMKSD